MPDYNLENLPDINFVDKDVETLLTDMITEYEQAYFDSTGIRKLLAPGDPVRIWIYSQALKIFQAYQLIDYSAKMNLLKYSEGDYLINLGALRGKIKNEAQSALTTVRFTLSAAQAISVPIAAGKRATPGNNVFFATKEYAEIPAGELIIDLVVECTTPGVIGNGYTAGQINKLADPIPYVASVVNLDTSQGGAEIESDDSFKRSIFNAPEEYSVAGPSGAYEALARKYSTQVLDARAYSPSAGVVNVLVILLNGDIPEPTFLDSLGEYLSAKTRRPLTDNVVVLAPTPVSYDVEFTYYIRRSDSLNAPAIQSAVAAAVDAYNLWQRSKIGRDINPSELTARVIKAGAKRLDLIYPEYLDIQDDELAVSGTITVLYGGLEDD